MHAAQVLNICLRMEEASKQDGISDPCVLQVHTAMADLGMLEIRRVMWAWAQCPCFATMGVGGAQSCRCCSCMPGSCIGSNAQSGAAVGGSMSMRQAAFLRQLLIGSCLKAPVCPLHCSSTCCHLPDPGIPVHGMSASSCWCCCCCSPPRCWGGLHSYQAAGACRPGEA